MEEEIVYSDRQRQPVKRNISSALYKRQSARRMFFSAFVFSILNA